MKLSNSFLQFGGVDVIGGMILFWQRILSLLLLQSQLMHLLNFFTQLLW